MAYIDPKKQYVVSGKLLKSMQRFHIRRAGGGRELAPAWHGQVASDLAALRTTVPGSERTQ